MATQFADNVVNGPSREQLFDALRLCVEKRVVQFTFTWIAPDDSRPERIEKDVYVDSIRAIYDDGFDWGNGMDWEIEGRAEGCETVNGLASVSIRFNTVSRTGRLDFGD